MVVPMLHRSPHHNLPNLAQDINALQTHFLHLRTLIHIVLYLSARGSALLTPVFSSLEHGIAYWPSVVQVCATAQCTGRYTWK
jgi:hypothetical protein